MVQISLKEFIEKSKEDPAFFASQILKLRLHEAQKEIIRCKDRFISVRAARRFGKSYCFSAMALWAACCNENYRVICVSRSQRQSSEMFRTIKAMAMSSLIADTITRSTLTRLELANGSSVESLPGSSYDSLRGLFCHMALVDEASFVNDELFAIIRPMLMTTKGRLVLISTPNFSSGEFFRSCQPDSEFTRFHFTHKDVKFADGSTLVDEEDLQREMIACGGENSAKYKREFLAEFTEAVGGFFDLDALNNCLKPDVKELNFGLENHIYSIGVDLAQKIDFTVFSVLDFTDITNIQLVKLVRFNGKSTDEILNLLYREVRAFNSKNILIDEAGIGRSMLEHLKVQYPGIPFKGFNFNSVSKVELLNDLNVALCNRILTLPENDVIRDELVSFCYEENPNTKNLKLFGKGAHDDVVISIALGLKATGAFKRRSGFTIATNKSLSNATNDDDEIDASKIPHKRSAAKSLTF